MWISEGELFLGREDNKCKGPEAGCVWHVQMWKLPLWHKISDWVRERMVKKMVRNNSQGPELGLCGSFYNELTKAHGRYVTEPNLKMLLFYSGICLRWFRAFLGFFPPLEISLDYAKPCYSANAILFWLFLLKYKFKMFIILYVNGIWLSLSLKSWFIYTYVLWRKCKKRQYTENEGHFLAI